LSRSLVIDMQRVIVAREAREPDDVGLGDGPPRTLPLVARHQVLKGQRQQRVARQRYTRKTWWNDVKPQTLEGCRTELGMNSACWTQERQGKADGGRTRPALLNLPHRVIWIRETQSLGCGGHWERP